MQVINITTDPKCLKIHTVYQSTATKQENGLWLYSFNNQGKPGKFCTFRPKPESLSNTFNEVYVFYAKFTLTSDGSSISPYQGCQVINSDSTHIIFKNNIGTYPSINPTLAFNSNDENATCLLENYAVYTLSDYEKLLTLGLSEPYFDYSTMPFNHGS